MPYAPTPKKHPIPSSENITPIKKPVVADKVVADTKKAPAPALKPVPTEINNPAPVETVPKNHPVMVIPKEITPEATASSPNTYDNKTSENEVTKKKDSIWYKFFKKPGKKTVIEDHHIKPTQVLDVDDVNMLCDNIISRMHDEFVRKQEVEVLVKRILQEMVLGNVDKQ